MSFTIAFFTLFALSERYSRGKGQVHTSHLEKFRLAMADGLSADALQIRPGASLVAVHNPHRLEHLRQVLERCDVNTEDVVALSVRRVGGFGAGEHELKEDQFFTDRETELFSRVVSLAEKEGKPVRLLVVPGVHPFDAMVQAAARLEGSRLVTGTSMRMEAQELARRIGESWERLPQPKPHLSLEIIPSDGSSVCVNLGPHLPALWPEDIDRTHRLWLELSRELGSGLHHRDIVGLALRRMQGDLHSSQRQELIATLTAELRGKKAGQAR